MMPFGVPNSTTLLKYGSIAPYFERKFRVPRTISAAGTFDSGRPSICSQSALVNSFSIDVLLRLAGFLAAICRNGSTTCSGRRSITDEIGRTVAGTH
jgi:hypothetical protein